MKKCKVGMVKLNPGIRNIMTIINRTVIPLNFFFDITPRFSIQSTWITTIIMIRFNWLVTMALKFFVVPFFTFESQCGNISSALYGYNDKITDKLLAIIPFPINCSKMWYPSLYILCCHIQCFRVANTRFFCYLE